MADAVSELLVTEAAIDKLGSRGITIEESHRSREMSTSPSEIHITASRARGDCLSDAPTADGRSHW